MEKLPDQQFVSFFAMANRGFDQLMEMMIFASNLDSMDEQAIRKKSRELKIDLDDVDIDELIVPMISDIVERIVRELLESELTKRGERP